ncbi:MAG: hypothetical protein [Caudoviricetes sp.]|nr:MAG: hypothetical protein [Caudoviricetes sp.]
MRVNVKGSVVNVEGDRTNSGLTRIGDSYVEAVSNRVSMVKIGALTQWKSLGKCPSLRKGRVHIKKMLKASYQCP